MESQRTELHVRENVTKRYIPNRVIKNQPTPRNIVFAWGAASINGRGQAFGPDDVRRIDACFEKAPSEIDIVERSCTNHYPNRYFLLRDLVLNISWSNRYAMPLYEKRPVRWGDVPRNDGNVFLPVYRRWMGAELADIIVDNYPYLAPAWNEELEDVLFERLITLFRGKPSSGAEISPVKPAVAEALADPDNLVLALYHHRPDSKSPTADAIDGILHCEPRLEELVRQTMVLSNLYPWDTDRSHLCKVRNMDDDDHVVLFYPKKTQAAKWIHHLRKSIEAGNQPVEHWRSDE